MAPKIFISLVLQHTFEIFALSISVLAQYPPDHFSVTLTPDLRGHQVHLVMTPKIFIFYVLQYTFGILVLSITVWPQYPPSQTHTQTHTQTDMPVA